MMIHRYMILIVVVGQIVFHGCGQKGTENQIRIESELPDPDSANVGKGTKEDSSKFKISLDNFTDIPKEIQGCSCFYSESEGKYLKREYLFAAGFDSTAFISIGNKLLRLRLVSTGRERLTFGDYDHTDLYKTDKYMITIDIKYLRKEGDEGLLNSGTLTIQSNDGQRESVKFYGGCGC